MKRLLCIAELLAAARAEKKAQEPAPPPVREPAKVVPPVALVESEVRR